MIFRLANVIDALELHKLNVLFNGIECNEIEIIKKTLENNNQEIIFVAEDNKRLVGFCCGQLSKSICYKSIHAEITELYVLEEYRKKGIAKNLIKSIEKEFISKGAGNVHILTNRENVIAQNIYKFYQYKETNTIELKKDISITKGTL